MEITITPETTLDQMQQYNGRKGAMLHRNGVDWEEMHFQTFQPARVVGDRFRVQNGKGGPWYSIPSGKRIRIDD